MDEIWLKFLVLVIPVVIYMFLTVLRDYFKARSFYKSYKKVEGQCSDIKYLGRRVTDVEGSYDIHYYSYIFTYSMDGKEYQISREEEIADMFWGSNTIKKGESTSIWVNPDNEQEIFIPLFDDNTPRAMSGLVILVLLFVFCGLIIGNSK